MAIEISLQKKLKILIERHYFLAGELAKPEIIQDQNRFKDLSKEYAQLAPTVESFMQYEENTHAMEAAKLLQEESDPEMRVLAADEIRELKLQQEQIEHEIKLQLIPNDPHDESNVYLEIRAGTGGDEAAIFAGDLFRMYSRYAEQKRWQIEIISQHFGEHGGFKEVIARIVGRGVYSQLKFESGAHRVQRVPATESQGRIHTSACTIAILPEPEEIGEVEIDPSQLKVDVYRASGAGGQHVNKTESAIRITHLPTGVVVECQDERSQHKNRAKAMALLKARLLAEEQRRQRDAQAQTRRDLVGSGDRSERIRTYNFPQGRVTDHRIGLTLYKLPEIMEGELNQIIEPLIREHQADLLARISE